MRTSLDTNILSTLWRNEPGAQSAAAALSRSVAQGRLLISPVVYAELLAGPGATEDTLDHVLAKLRIQIDWNYSREAWSEAGRRYAQHAERRRRAHSGPPRRILADFLVGAHALFHADSLLTLDQTYFRRDFPDLPLTDIET